MDIDIDFADREKILNIIEHIRARRDHTHHNTGIYAQHIPHDPVNNIASIDYKTAENRGYFKIDFLNLNVYKDIRDELHLKTLMETEPLWDLLEQQEFVDLLFHLNGHSSILKMNCPNSLEQLAAVLAMIRPAKKHLIGKSWTEILNQVWTKPDNNEYYFKKAHAIAYAMAVVVQMNLICESIGYGYD